MARIVCQVLHRPNRVTFIWSDGTASFEPYHLQDQELQAFYQAARAARQHLARIVAATDAQAAVDLAMAGSQLFKSIFRHNANDPVARDIQNWLHELRDRNEIASLDMLSDAPGRIPWNTVYDQEPTADALRAGDPGALRPFWGFQYPLASGKRVNPLRVAGVLDNPRIVVAADPELLDKLPAAQKNLLGDWAISRELNILDSVSALHNELRDEAPDILYLFANVDQGALGMGADSVTIGQIREFLANAKAGNPEPIVFLQACGAAANWEGWECFVAAAVNMLAGVVMCEAPAAPALANALGVDALTRLLQNQGVGQCLKSVRGDQGLAALAYSAFCPAHVKVTADSGAEPDVPGPELLPLPEYPYRPLAPFESEDRALFTGREDETVRCAGLVDEAATPGLVLHGAGGVGKSSFLRAGLVPHLETEAVGYVALRDRTPDDGIHKESDYPVVALRPGSDLLGQLAEALCVFCAQPLVYTTPRAKRISVDLPGTLRALVDGVPPTAITAAPAYGTETGDTAISSMPLAGAAAATGSEPAPAELSAASLWNALDQDPHLLAVVLDEVTRPLPFELVVVIEQAEDWVLQTNKAAARRRQQALESLSGVLRSAARCKVILSVRTEYFGRLMDDVPGGHERWRSFFLKELGAEQMVRAMLWPTAAEPVPYSSEIPREKYRFTFEQDVASQLVEDVERAARSLQRSPLPLLQIVCAGLYDRATQRKQEVIAKADRKDQGPVEEAVNRFVNKKIKDLPLSPRDGPVLRELMGRLYLRHTDGTVSRALVPAADLARSWKSATPLETVVDTAAGEGLVEANEMMVEGRPQLFLSLPQEALAQTAHQWEEDRKRKAFGRTRIIDTLWIMVPMLFLVAAITWTVTRRVASASSEEAPVKEMELAKKFIEQQQRLLESGRWQTYVGDLVRADQAWNNANPLLARQILQAQQPAKEQEDLRDFEWYYLWNKIRGRGPEDTGHKRPITSVAMSADGALGASASMDGAVKLWDLNKLELIATLPGHTGSVLAVAFSPDGKILASAGADKVIRLWDAVLAKEKPAAGIKEQKALTGHTDEVRVLAFGPQALVSGGADKQVIIWDLATGKPAEVFADHTSPIVALALAPDGKSIASAGTDPGVLIHVGAKKQHAIKTPGPISALAFALDGKQLATAGAEKQELIERGMIRFWDPGTGKETGTPLQHATGVFALVYVPETKLLASAGKDNLVRLWDTAAARQVAFHEGHVDWVVALAVSASGRTLFSGSRDDTVKLWGVAPPDAIRAHAGAAQAVLFALDDKAVISGGQDGTLKFWDPATGKELAKPFSGPGAVTSLAVSAKESPAKVAAGTWNEKNEGDLRLWELTWDAKEGLKTKELPPLKGHTQGITCLAFSGDGKMLASGSADQTVILWDVASGKQLFVLNGHGDGARCLAFPRDDGAVRGPGFLITGAGDGKVRTWNVVTGSEYRPAFQAHAGPINAIGFFFGIVGFVTAGEDHATKFWVWNPDEQPAVSSSQRSNTQPVTALVFSPNRRFLVTASLDQTAKLFNSQIDEDRSTRFFSRERFTFTGAGTPLRAVAVSANNLIVAAAGADGTIRLWRAAAPKAPKQP